MAICYPQLVTSMDLLQSTIRLDRLGPFLASQGVQLAALTNSTLYGVQAFYKEMVRHSIQPVIGLRYHLELSDEDIVQAISYATNETGWKHLLKLSSALETRHVDALPTSWFRAYSKGLLTAIVVTEETYPRIASYFSASVIPAVSSETADQVAFIDQLKSRHPLVLPYAPAQLENEEDRLAFRVLQALSQGKKLQETEELPVIPLLTRPQWDEQFASLGNWQSLFFQLFSEGYTVSDNVPKLPRFPVPEGTTADAYLARLATSQLEKKGLLAQQVYIERLKYELTVIQSMGYSDYFLIVQDFINFAKLKGISVGPGRGSSASSLVAYVLGITGIDPIEYGLLFERFLNPERVSLPDIDVDFADYRRDEVIRYVQQKYGEQFVAQIVAFGTLSTKAVAREVARVMELPQETLAFLSRSIPAQVASLEVAVSESAELQDFIAREEKHELWYQLAKRLEGMPRNTTVHAAGVVISPKPLVEVVPIEEHHDGIYLTQWTMKEVEQAGLLKMDFLGLRNLTMLDQMTASIRETQSQDFSLARIDREDKKALALLSSGDTLGVFQFESPGMKKALQTVHPTSFREVVAVNALFRPGPMAFIPNFAARKLGKESVRYVHPAVEPILKETYGIIVYQEQIMQIARSVAGYSYAEADNLRRAVSKKDRNVLTAEKARFTSRAQQQGVAEQTASTLYDFIVRFAEYGFPKSHATAYSLIAMQMAYIKAHYPEAFYTTLLTSTTGNKEKQVAVFREMKRRGLALLPPDLWKSLGRFTVDKGGIRVGLSSIKGIPRPFMQHLLTVRKQRTSPWKSLFELAADLSAHYFTRATIEPLIKAGALDFLKKDRAVLLASLDPAIMHAELVRPSVDTDLLSGAISSFGEPKYTEATAMPDTYKLAYEKEVLGTFLSAHPVEAARNQFNSSLRPIDEIQLANGKQVELVGLLKDIRKIRTKKGQAMAFGVLEDERDEIDLTFFPEVFASVNIHLKEQAVVLVRGKVEQRNGKSQLIVQSLQPL